MTLYNWFKVDGIPFSSLQEDRLTEVLVESKRVGMLRRAGQLHAFPAACPHAGGPLCEGWLDALGRIVCPDHKYRFDPTTGRNTSGEGYKLFLYPVEIRDDEIYIGFLP